MTYSPKLLGRKAYGSIGHLPTSRMGAGDHHVAHGQADICTLKLRDKHDRVIVQEKLDGSCVAAALLADGRVVALGRAGHLAQSSPYEQHQLWAVWVSEREQGFRDGLRPGERVCGEWIAQAHGTRYEIRGGHEPFVAFDIMAESQRESYDAFYSRLHEVFTIPHLLHIGGPIAVVDAYAEAVKKNHHGALDPIEGVVYRVERKGKVDFLAKWVRPDKVDGSYLPDIAKCEPVWNWRP